MAADPTPTRGLRSSGGSTWPSFLEVLAGRAPEIADETAEVIRTSIPAYGRAWAAVGPGVREVVRLTNLQLVRLWREGRGLRADEAEFFAGMAIPGEATGISLDDTMHAYRLSFGVTWRHITEMQDVYPGLTRKLLMEKTVEGFQYLNDLSIGITRHAVLREREELQAREDAERELLEALLSRPPRLEQATRTARALRVPFSGEVCAVAVRPRPSAEEAGGARATTSWLRALRTAAGHNALLVAPADGLLYGVFPGEPLTDARTLPGSPLGVGRTHAGIRGLAASCDEAREALSIARRNGLDRARFGDLWLDRLLDGSLSVRDLASEMLEPLSALAASKRGPLQATLAVYLSLDRSITGTAKHLQVHPHTVRYRLAKIRELLGDVLDVPDHRLALQIALREHARRHDR